MRKISLFLLIIFGLFIVFAQENAPETEQKPVETSQEAQPAEAAPEAPKEDSQNVETLPETSQSSETSQSPETSQESQQEATAQEAEAKEESKEESQPEDAKKAETTKAVKDEREDEYETDFERDEDFYIPVDEDEATKTGHKSNTEYYRPYLGVGVPLVVIGTISVLVLMPSMGAMAFAASDGCKDKDWAFCEQCRNDHHTAWTTGAVLSGVVGAGMIVTGSWLVSVQKPRENLNVTLNSFTIVPRKNGMFASIGFKF